MTKQERYALYYFIRSRPDDDYNLVLKNDILNALRDQEFPPIEYASVMVHLFKIKSLNVTNRMYILQHLRPWYEEHSFDRETILPVFYEALSEIDSGIAGTALLALNSLRKDFPEIDQNKISEAALEIAQADTQSILSRISAVQVCAKMNLADSQAIIRDLAQENLPTNLRIAAVAALGDIGTDEDIPILEKIITNEHKRYQKAARTAITKIKAKGNKI